MSLIFPEIKPPSRQGRFSRFARGKTKDKAQDHDRLYDNKLEAEYAAHLEAERQAGKIRAWWPKPFSIRLSRRCRYELDFLVQTNSWELVIHETKGYMEDDALVKLRFVREEYPFRVFVVRKEKSRGGFEWALEEFTP